MIGPSSRWEFRCSVIRRGGKLYSREISGLSKERSEKSLRFAFRNCVFGDRRDPSLRSGLRKKTFSSPAPPFPAPPAATHSVAPGISSFPGRQRDQKTLRFFHYCATTRCCRWHAPSRRSPAG